MLLNRLLAHRCGLMVSKLWLDILKHNRLITKVKKKLDCKTKLKNAKSKPLHTTEQILTWKYSPSYSHRQHQPGYFEPNRH